MQEGATQLMAASGAVVSRGAYSTVCGVGSKQQVLEGLRSGAGGPADV
jgi:hypothetical protein